MTNIGPSIATYKVETALTRANTEVSKSMERLATGKANAHAGDRSSYVAMSDTFRLDYVGTKAGLKSAAVALGYIETGLRTIESASTLLSRLQELAVLSANATNTDADAAAIDAEGEAIADEFHRILSTATYKGKSLFQDTTDSLELALGGRGVYGTFGVSMFDYDQLYDYKNPTGALTGPDQTYRITSALTDDEKDSILAQTTGLTASDLVVGTTFTTNAASSQIYGGAGVAVGDLVYSDTDSTVAFDNKSTFESASTFNGETIEIEVTNNGESSDNFSLISGDGSVGSISVTNGVVSYNDATHGWIEVGEISSTYNGQNGQKLKIDLYSDASIPGTSNVLNGDFSSGLDYWNVSDQGRIDFGNSFTITDSNSNVISIATPSESDMAIPTTGSPPNNDDGTSTAGAFTATVNSDGELALDTGGLTTDPSAIIHGPAVVSDSFTADAGDIFKFDYSAVAGGDHYHVAGYLLNMDDNTITMALNDTGASGSGSASVAVSTSGNYRFVFINGTYDATGGTAAGASMTIDNIRSEDPYSISSDVVQEILQSASYNSSSTSQAIVKDVNFSVSNAATTLADTAKILNNEFTNNLSVKESYDLEDPLSYAINNTMGVNGTPDTSVITNRIEAVQQQLNNARVGFGSQYAALESAISYITDLTAQYELGYNTVNDVNFSMETAHLAKQQILQNAAQAMLSQANVSQQGLLTLIKS